MRPTTWTCVYYSRGERCACGTAHRTYQRAQHHAAELRRAARTPGNYQTGWAPTEAQRHTQPERIMED